MASCKNCLHHPICEWCDAHTSEFHFPKNEKGCEMYNSALDDIEDAISSVGAEAKRLMNEAEEKSLYHYFRGRWTACKDILEFMSVYDALGREIIQQLEVKDDE